MNGCQFYPRTFAICFWIPLQFSELINSYSSQDSSDVKRLISMAAYLELHSLQVPRGHPPISG